MNYYQLLNYYFLRLVLLGCITCSMAFAQVVDLSGKAGNPLKSAKIIVLIFIRTDCPISNRYAPEIKRLAEKYQSRNLKFFLVYPGTDQSPELIKKHLVAFAFQVEAVRDPQLQLVKSLSVSVTPEAVVLKEGQMIYRGRIDNRFVGFGKMRTAPTLHDLEQVLEAVRQGKTVTKKTTKAIGCFIS